jgi:DUF4097 and DUF4098 domain-containing protein YvlB
MVIPALAADQHHQQLLREGNEWVQESTGPLDREKSLAVTRFVGSVQVTVTGNPSGSYVLRLHSRQIEEKDARKQFATFHLGVGHKGGEIVMQTVGPVDLAIRPELIVRLPAMTENLHVDTLAGKIAVHGKMNHLDLQTHGGDIELDSSDVLRAVTMGGSVIVNHRIGDSLIRTGGGDIRVDSSVGDLEIVSLGGNIWLKAIAQARIQSGGGNIEVVRCNGSLLVRTAGGNINLGEMGGAVTAETGGGNIRIGVAHGGVVASTALGNIELWKLSKGADAHTGMGWITAEFIGNRASMRDSELVTSTGNIRVYFADTVPGNLHAVTGTSPTRQIFSDFPDLKMSNGDSTYGPRSIAAVGAIHGGGPPIEVRTMSGQIELRNVRSINVP